MIRSAFVAAILALATGHANAQTPAASVVGAWRADTPLPNGVVQTFRFNPDSTFNLAMELAVDGTYRTQGNELIETVTLPSVGVTHTDTATFSIVGDSLMVNDRAGTPPRVLRRTAAATTAASIAGAWSIQIGDAATAYYQFGSDGAIHVRARVGDEQGRYLVHGDTLRLSNDKTFQLPAVAQFAVTDTVLTLTPQNGKQPRHFHKVSVPTAATGPGNGIPALH